MIALLFALASNSALAGNYDAELAIPSVFPANQFSASKELTYSRALYGDPNAVDAIVNSTDPRVFCSVENGLIMANFRSAASTWPTTPFNATCTQGSNTLRVDVVWMSTAVDPALQSHTIENNTITYTRPQSASMMKMYRLPDCASNYSQGLVSSSIAGVKCRVKTLNGVDFVRIEAGANSVLGTGTCQLPLSNSTVYTLNLDLSEAPI